MVFLLVFRGILGLVAEYVIRYGFQVGTFVVRVPKKFVSSFPKNEWERIRKNEWKIDQDKAKDFFRQEIISGNMEQSIMNYAFARSIAI